MSGNADAALDAWVRAHQAHVESGNLPRAARCAFWLAFDLLNRGQFAQAGGWLAKAQTVLEGHPGACVEQGYLLIPAALQCLEEGQATEAWQAFQEISEIAARFDDKDLTALALLGRGRTLIELGKFSQGVSMLDEAMVEVVTEVVSPIVAGTIYCAVIDACQGLFDFRRAREWTEALSAWCDGQSDLVAYRGECLMQRGAVLQRSGRWPEAMSDTLEAIKRLSYPAGQEAAGAAFYQKAELLRLLGDSRAAREAYRAASQRGQMV